MTNRYKEVNNNQKLYEAWTISKKYTQILMKNDKSDEDLNMCFDLYNALILTKIYY